MNAFLREEKVMKELQLMENAVIQNAVELAKPKLTDVADKLRSLGLKAAVGKIEQAAKMKFAYEKYLFVSTERVSAFNEKLKNETIREDETSYHFKHLKFIPLENYTEIPAAHVLEALESAQKDCCFDAYEVAKIEWVEQIKDPIVFGTINGCTDKFFIAQWDDDVSIDDLMFSD
jgi:hypothetical protein